MKKRSVVSALGILAAAASSASAQLVYEPMDYSTATSATGTNLANLTGAPTFAGYQNPMNGQTWFDTGTNGAGAEQTLSNNNLTPTGAGVTLAPSYGGALQYNGGGTAGAHLSTDKNGRIALGQTITGGSIYYSFLLNISDLTHESPNFVAGLNSTVGTSTGTLSGAALLATRPDGSGGYNIGIRTIGGTAKYQTTPTSFSTSDSVFVVARYTFNGGGNNDDTADLWLNPTSLGTGTAPTPDVTETTTESGASAVDILQIQSFWFRQGNTAVPNGITVDELRLDTDWAQVTAPIGSHFNSGADWTTGNWIGPVPNAAEQFAYFDGAGGNVNLDADQTVGTVTFRCGSDYTISTNAGKTLSFNGGTGGSSAINVQATMDPASNVPGTVKPATHTISANLSLTNDLITNVGVGQTLNLSGNIGETAASSLTKQGAGVLVLSGTGTYTGGTNVRAGVLRAADGPALSSANINLNGGVFESTAATFSRPAGTGAGQIQLGNVAGFSAFGTPVAVNLGGAGDTLTWGSGGFNPGTLVLNASTADNTLDFQNSVNLNGAARSVSVATNTATLSGVVSGDGGIVKTGAGTLVLGNSANTYNGAVTLKEGILAIGSDGALGQTSPDPENNPYIKGDGGTLQFLNSFTLDNRLIQVFPGGLTIDTAGNDVLYVGKIFTFSGGDTLTIASSTGNGIFQMNNTAGGSYRNLVLKSGTFSVNADAELGDTIDPTHPVTFDGGTLQVYNQDVNISGNRVITVTANGGTFDTNGRNTASPVSITGVGAFTVKGNGSGHLSLPSITTPTLNLDGGNVNFTSAFSSATDLGVTANNGTLDLSNDVALGAVSGAGTLNKIGVGNLTVNSVRSGGLNVGAGKVTIAQNGTNAATSIVNTLSIAGATDNWTAQLDVKDNDVIVHSDDAGRIAKAAEITNQLKQGANFANAGQFWTGNGIVTSLGGNGSTSYTAVGVAVNDFATLGGSQTGTIYSTFDGQDVGVNDVLVKYTYFGDADLDGAVTTNDYFQIDNGFLGSKTGWINGDFDYDGAVTTNDYFLIDNAFLGQGAALVPAALGSAEPLSGVTAVPEPASLGVFAFAAAAGLLRRRRAR
jgi:autotransporter-associated beta strand protein